MLFGNGAEPATVESLVSVDRRSHSEQRSTLPRRVAQTILIADDDMDVSSRLVKELQQYNFAVTLAHSVGQAAEAIASRSFSHALIELRLRNESSFRLLPLMKAHNPDARIVVQSCYVDLPTTVMAVQCGAYDVLSKPADTACVLNILFALPVDRLSSPVRPMSADRVKWEHINRVFEKSGMNVSLTARELRMHRRTLQRILAKRPPRV